MALAALDAMRASIRDEAVGRLLHSLHGRFLRLFRAECDRLDIHRIGQGETALRVEGIDLRRLCEEVAAATRPLAERCRILVDVEPGDGGRRLVLLDRDRTEEMLICLLGDALRTVGEDGRVALRLEDRGEATRISLLAPGARSGAMTSALRLAGALASLQGGALLGSRAVELRDARPAREPDGAPPGQGAIAEWMAAIRRNPQFRLLPVETATDRQAASSTRGLVQATRVLLVSDDERLGRLVDLLLEDDCFLVTAASAKAADVARTVAPDVILSDSPVTCVALREHMPRDIPLLLLAGAGTSPEGSAADAVLRRPFSAPDLRTTVRKLLRREAVEDSVEEDRLASLTLVAAGVAHEVLNPLWFLTLALFDLDRLLKGAEIPPPVWSEGARLVESARAGLDRVSQVMGDLRAYALREDAARPVPTDLHEGIRRTLRLLLLRRPESVRVHTQLCDDGRVTCRAGRVNQVFFNLVLNALQAVGDEGEIWIRSWIEADRLHVSIRDTGPGIPAEHLGSLFRPFFTTKDPGRSSGLGLASSRRIVKEHGGEIQVRSEVGRGSEFVTILPRALPPNE